MAEKARRCQAAAGMMIEAGMDDDLPQRTKAPKRNLDMMGIAELEDYIAELQEEIERVRNTIKSKQSVRGGADALFKR